MLKTFAVALVAALSLAACGPNGGLQPNLDPSWPDVADFYRLGPAGPECDGPRSVQIADEGNRITCTWTRVVVDGEPRCTAIVVFHRSSADAPWGLSRFVTHANVCPED